MYQKHGYNSRALFKQYSNLNSLQHNPIQELPERKLIGEVHTDVGLIKNTLVDINVEIACLKDVISKRPPTAASSNKFKTTDDFAKCDSAIRNDKDEFDSFFANLQHSVDINSKAWQDMCKYFKSILQNFFENEIFDNLVWKPYGAKMAIGGSRVVDAIQLSALKIDALSTEANRRQVLQTVFRKHKDACRPRRRAKGINFEADPKMFDRPAKTSLLYVGFSKFA